MDLQKAVSHLRDDHMNITNQLLDAKIRISKLEDIVRALTAQRSVAQDAPRMAQEIEATTRYGKTVVLKIPKGQALVPLRPSRSLTPTPPNHRADSAPDSQVSEDNVTVDCANQPTSSQSTFEINAQPEDPKIETIEKVSFNTHIEWQSIADQKLPQPLPPVPAAAAYPTASYIKPETLENGWESGNQQASAALQDNIHATTPSWGASMLSAIPPVQLAPDTPRVGEEPAPIPRSKGKGKKKWTDPPIFQDSQPSAGANNTEDVKDDTKTLFSYHDIAEASTTGRDITVRPEAREQKVAHPENVSSIREVTNQTTASQPLTLNTLAHQPGPSRTETSNSKRLFKELLRNNNADHGQRLPHQSTATQAGAQPTSAPAPAPASTRVFSSAGGMARMMQSVAPKANYVTRPEAATTSRENAVPRAPVSLTATNPAAATASGENAASRAGVKYKITPRVPARTDSPASSDGSSAKPGKMRWSAVKKVDTSSSSEHALPAQLTAIVPPAQASPSSLEQTHSPASFAAAPQLPTSTATTTTPAVTSRPTMNARVASFQPSTSFATNATPYSTASNVSPFREMLMAKMAPADAARFAQSMSNSSA
jgi:hypothetical protein